MSNNTIPLDLLKANLDLQLNIARLLRENGRRWLDAPAESGAEHFADSIAAMAQLLNERDFHMIASRPLEVLWQQIQQDLEGAQAFSHFAVSTQVSFNEGLQRAIQDWYQAVSGSLGEAGDKQPLQDLMNQWSSLWSPITKRK